jgi:soluble lytic murein transglycosylase-like protein
MRPLRKTLKVSVLIIALNMLFAVTARIPAVQAGLRDDSSALIRKGVYAYQAGAPKHALAYFTGATRLAPESSLAFLWAGVAAVAAGQRWSAETYFGEALKRPHSPAQASIIRAWLDRLAVFRNPAPAQIASLALTANPRLSWAQAKWIGLAVDAASKRQGLDPRLLAAVIYVESRFNHASVSGAGAMGLGQLMPSTAQAAGVDPRDPWGNLVGAAEVLRWNYLAFRSWPLALAAYNAGEGTVRRYNGIPPYAETQWYVDAVLYVYGQLRSS